MLRLKIGSGKALLLALFHLANSGGGVAPAVDGVIQAENSDFLQTESGDYLAIE